MCRGVEVKFKDKCYPVIIAATHIAQLTAVVQQVDGIHFGASTTINNMEKVLKIAVQDKPGGSPVIIIPLSCIRLKCLLLLSINSQWFLNIMANPGLVT